jgi:hypothetical protein
MNILRPINNPIVNAIPWLNTHPLSNEISALLTPGAKSFLKGIVEKVSKLDGGKPGKFETMLHKFIDASFVGIGLSSPLLMGALATPMVFSTLRAIATNPAAVPPNSGIITSSGTNIRNKV